MRSVKSNPRFRVNNGLWEIPKLNIPVTSVAPVPPVTAMPEMVRVPVPPVQTPARAPTAYVNHTMCCGLKYIHGVQNQVYARVGGAAKLLCITPEEVLSDVHTFMKKEGYSYYPGVFVFVDTSGRQFQGGAALAEYIEKNDLGTVLVSAPNKNPNSGYNITTYTWNVNHETMVF